MIVGPIQSRLPRPFAHNLADGRAGGGGVIDDEALFGDGVEDDDKPFGVGGLADMFVGDFLGLRELGAASKVQSIEPFCPEEASAAEKCRNGHGKLITVRGTILFYPFAYSSMMPLFVSRRSKPSEPPPLFPLLPPLISFESTGWKTG